MLTALELAKDANEYRLAKLRRETLESRIEAEEKTLETFIEEAKKRIPIELQLAWTGIERELKALREDLKEAKENESNWKTLLTNVAYQAALETEAQGRELHPSIQVQRTHEVRLPLYPGRVVDWLVENGKAEDVKISIKDINWWRNQAISAKLPEGVSLVEIPLIKIDSKWE